MTSQLLVCSIGIQIFFTVNYFCFQVNVTVVLLHRPIYYYCYYYYYYYYHYHYYYYYYYYYYRRYRPS